MAAPKLQPLTFLIPVIFFTLFWGTWMLLIAIWQFLKNPRLFLTHKKFEKIPEIASDHTLGKHGFITIDGAVDEGSKKLRIHYVANGEEDKPLMLCLHGFPECWYSWRFQLREFNKQYRVVAVDLRGYGESDKPSGINNYCMDFLCADVKAIVHALGYEKCVLMGHDWGGAITWGVAAKYPEICEKVVIMNAPHSGAFKKCLQGSLKQFLASWYMFYFQFPYLPEIMMKARDFMFLALVFRGKSGGLKNKDNFTPEDLDVFKYYFDSFDSRNAAINYYRAAMRYNARVPQHHLSMPLLIVWGEEDTALTKQLAVESASYVENCTLQYIKGASHWVQQDAPESVNSHVWKFLE